MQRLLAVKKAAGQTYCYSLALCYGPHSLTSVLYILLARRVVFPSEIHPQERYVATAAAGPVGPLRPRIG